MAQRRNERKVGLTLQIKTRIMHSERWLWANIESSQWRVRGSNPVDGGSFRTEKCARNHTDEGVGGSRGVGAFKWALMALIRAETSGRFLEKLEAPGLEKNRLWGGF